MKYSSKNTGSSLLRSHSYLLIVGGAALLVLGLQQLFFISPLDDQMVIISLLGLLFLVGGLSMHKSKKKLSKHYAESAKDMNVDWKSQKGIVIFMSLGFLISTLAAVGVLPSNEVLKYIKLLTGSILVYRGIISIIKKNTWVPMGWIAPRFKGTSAIIIGFIYLATGTLLLFNFFES